MQQQAIHQRAMEQHGFVVWDQQGLVVRWSDGSSQRFSWETLRHLSLCETCREQDQHRAPLVQSSAALAPSQID
jgi:DUF971 family protein